MKHSFISSTMSKMLVLYGIIKSPLFTVTYIFCVILCTVYPVRGETAYPLFTLPSRYLEPFTDSVVKFDSIGSRLFRNGTAAITAGHFDEGLLALDSSLSRIPEMGDYIHVFRLQALVALHRLVEADTLIGRISRLNKWSAASSLFVIRMLNSRVPADPLTRLYAADRLTRNNASPEALYLCAALADSIKERQITERCRIDLLRIRHVNTYSDSTAARLFEERAKFGDRFLLELARFFEWRMKWKELLQLSVEIAKRKGDFRVQFLSMAYTAAYRSRDYFEALRLMRLWEKHGGRTPETLFKYALNLEKLQYWRASWILYREYLRRWPKGIHGDNFLWDLGRRFEKGKRLDKAAKVYFAIERGYPKELYAGESRFRAAYCLYKMGLFDSAATVFSGFEKRYADEKYTDASIYWAGRAYQATGMTDSSHLYYSKIIQRDPMSFYALMAEDRLLENGSDSLVRNLYRENAYPLDYFIDSADMEVSLEDEDPLPIKRGLLLLQCGMNDLAVEEFDLAAKWARKRIGRLFRLSRLYQNAGYFAKSFRTGMEISYRIPPRLRRVVPPEMYKIFFPRFFGESVNLESRRLGIDPLFVHAVMRQESQFDHRILSRAGAVGLLQLMPATAREVARKMEATFDHDSLKHPFYNIKIGSYHLSELLDKFDGSMEWSFAAYNAGATPAKRWKSETEGIAYDMMFEEIAYGETRQYVKLCTRNYRFYKRIWADGE